MRLIAKDQLSPDKVMDVVKAHSEKVLFPRLENRFGDSLSHDFQQETTSRPMTSLSLSQSLGPSSTAGPRTRTSSSTRQLRPKSPSSGVQLKVFSMEKLEESLTAIKVCPSPLPPLPPFTHIPQQSTVDIVAQMDPSSPLHSPHLDDDFSAGKMTKGRTAKSSTEAAAAATEKQTKKRKGKNSRQQQHLSKEGDGDEEGDGEDDDWLFDTEDLSPLRHISSPKDKVRVYKRQTTPYPEEISESTLEKENELSARFRGSHDNELISEGGEEDWGGNEDQGKKKRFTRTYTLDDDDGGRKVQFQDDWSTQQRPSTEPSSSAHRKDSFKTRKQTPFPHEIEEANDLLARGGEGHSPEEISLKKKSFQQRKNTPFPHEMEEEIKKSSSSPSSARSSSHHEEREANHEEDEDLLLLPSLKDGEHDPEFDSYRQQHQSRHHDHPPSSSSTSSAKPTNPLFVDLDEEELHCPQSSDDPRRGEGGQRGQREQKQRQGQGHPQTRPQYEGSQSVPMSRQTSKRQSSADSFSSSPSPRGGNVRLRPLTPEGHFRREFSKDHPLAGGKGKYSREMMKGKEWMGPQAALVKKKKHQQAPLRISEIVSKQEQKKLDLQRQLEELRKHQNEVLLEVLEEERKAEMERVDMGRNISDHEERRRYPSLPPPLPPHLPPSLCLM
jgi:hypothetical protein